MRTSSKHSGPVQRQQLPLLFWCVLCLLTTLQIVPSLHPTARHVLYVFFQPVAPPLLMLWLWGAAVKRFAALNVDYETCFAARDRRFLLSGEEIQKIALVLWSIALSLVASFTAAAYLQAYMAAELLPFFMYIGLALVVMLPLPILHRSSRNFFVNTCQRVLLPLQEVSWADFLLADIFCSLSKSSADFTLAMCNMATGPVMQSLAFPSFQPSAICAPTGLLGLLGVCLPYLIRFIQCLIVFRTTGNKAQIFNAVKYSSSFPALILTAFEHEAHMEQRPFALKGTWLLVMVVNTCYSFYWDLEQDWDMPWLWASVRGLRPTAGRSWRLLLPSLKPDSIYSPKAWYTWAMVSNLVLRLAWVHRLMGGLERSPAISLTLAFLEALRRYQWSYIRVETELRKIARGGSNGLLGLGVPSGEGSGGTGALLHKSSGSVGGGLMMQGEGGSGSGGPQAAGGAGGWQAGGMMANGGGVALVSVMPADGLAVHGHGRSGSPGQYMGHALKIGSDSGDHDHHELPATMVNRHHLSGPGMGPSGSAGGLMLASSTGNSPPTSSGVPHAPLHHVSSTHVPTRA